MRGRDGVSPVIAVILMVAITVVLAAVVYLTVTSLVQETQSLAPFLALGQAEFDGNQATLQVVAVGDQTFNLDNYEIVLVINESVDEASMISSLAVGTTGNVTFEDITGVGKLTVGDEFTITVVPGTRYDLSVVFRGKGVSGSQDWHTM